MLLATSRPMIGLGLCTCINPTLPLDFNPLEVGRPSIHPAMDVGQKPLQQLDNDPRTTESTNSTALPCNATEGLLEPTLKFDYDTIVNNLHKSDQTFAREVVRLIAERAGHGIFARDCWGYRFLDPPVYLHIPLAPIPDFRRRLDHISSPLVGMIYLGLARILTGNDSISSRSSQKRILEGEEL